MAAEHTPVDPAPDRALFISVRLFVAGDAFFFIGFLFAYLYLRALDTNDMWHPSGIDPSIAIGTVLVASVVLSAVALRLGTAGARRGMLAAAAGLMLVAVVCQGVQLFDPGYSPSHGGAYGSVFVGFAAGFVAHLLGGLYWLETLVVDRDSSPAELETQARTASVYVTFLAGVALVAYVLLYLV
jgi:heme/copper-type cytochrome/quinol oxidase subunit 3